MLESYDLKKYLPDHELKAKTISEAPLSTLLSMRSQKIVDFSKKEQINRNLLQVTIGQRAFVIDLDQKNCIYDFCDME